MRLGRGSTRRKPSSKEDSLPLPPSPFGREGRDEGVNLLGQLSAELNLPSIVTDAKNSLQWTDDCRSSTPDHMRINFCGLHVAMA